MKHFLRFSALLILFLSSSAFLFAQCPTILSVASTNKTCNPGPDNGTITIALNANGYTGNYTYQILGVPPTGPLIFQSFSGTADSHTFINLPIASYNVFVTPDAPCTNLLGTPQVITQPAAFSASVSSITPSCTPGTGAITLNVAGGTTAYSFAWTGPTAIGNVQNPTGLNSGIYSVIITDANTCTTTINNISVPVSTPAAAGGNQVICAFNTTLAGNAPLLVNETGTWTVQSGTASFANANDPNTTVTGLSAGDNILRWTITDSGGICPGTFDDVTIHVDAPPTVAAAGSDQALCNVATTTLAANAAVVGTGAWTIVSGTGGTVVTPASPTSTFNGAIGATYVLRWTISNGSCTPSTDDVQIRFDQTPTTSAAGPDQALCNLATTTLAANVAAVGTGAWSIVSGTGGTVVTPASPTSTFNGVIGTTYVLRWTISNGACPSSSDDVQVRFDQTPTPAAAGPDQTLCATTATLAANAPAVGTGTWTIQSGTGGTVVSPNSPTSAFNGTAGVTYVLRWTITNGSCAVSFDDVQIRFDQAPTTSAAGSDQALCNVATTTLAGNTPAIGTGAWSIISGTGGAVVTPSSPTSTFNGVIGNTYVLRWTISNGSCPASTDDVQIRFDQTPTTSAAGPDQALCNLATTTLAANVAAVGTGAWSIVSGTGGTVVTPASPTSTFNGVIGTTYVLRWTISNGSCAASTDDVQIRFDQTPTTAAAGTDQTLCATTATLAANTPAVGTGTWTIQSGTGGTIVSPNSPTSTFNGTAGATYVLRWTISNGSCTASFDDVQIRFDQAPTTAAAGTDQALCNVITTTLAGNTPVIGTGAWSIISGAGGTVVTPASPTSTFNGVAGTTYVLRWTISNGSCPASTDDVQVRFDQTPTTSGAGPDQALCNVATTTLAANVAAVGTGAWTIVSGTGGTVVTPTSPTSNFNGVIGTTYVLRWTISSGSCPASTDDVQVRFDQPPTTSAAGPDQTVCGTATTLAGNTPAVGTGTWTIVSGTGGTIVSVNSPTSAFNGTVGTTYVLRWTISGGSCPSSADDVQIRFDQAPTISAAGPDQALCNVATTTLAANTATVGTGAWSIVSGTGGTVVTPASPTSTFNGAVGTTYVLRWTITNGSCTASTDDVQVRFDALPTAAAAGPDQNLCSTATTTLAGNTPVTGTGQWAIVSGTGGTIVTPTSPTSTFNGTAGTTYVLSWTITNGTCTSTDNVQIKFDVAPTIAAAGPDQAICATTTNLAANTPTVGIGAWTIQSGTGGSVVSPNSPTSVFNGTAGTTYVLRWSISNGSCTASFDDVTITFNQAPTTSAAGPDQTLCNVTTTNLAANTPAIGTGAWTIVSGTGGAVVTPASPTSAFNGTAGTTYVLRWTITSGSCTASTDDVQIVFEQPPTTAAAGPDQTVCGPATLAANTPTIGVGQWSIVSGTGGSFGNITNPATTFTGTGGTTYVLRWTITNVTCPPSTDDVSITFDNNTPTIANAGPDQAICTTNTNLAGNTPVVGTGAWSIFSGTGGTIANPASPTSAFNGTAGVTYVLRWTISNGACTPTVDDVTITFEVAPTTAAAGPDQTVCGTTVTLAGNVATSGAGIWTIVSGTGGSFTNATSPVTDFTGTAGQSYVLRWTISNSCGNSSDDVSINLNGTPTVAAAGPDQTVCGPATLAANAPLVGIGKWTIVSGTGGSFADDTDPATTFSGTGGTTYVLRWTISSGACTASTDDVSITFDNNTPTTANAGSDQTICGTNATLAGNTPVVGTGQWTVVTGVGGSFTDDTDPATAFTGTAGVTYTLRWTITSSCGNSSDDVDIQLDAPPTTAAAGPDQTVCGPATLAANTPVVGTGQWSVVSGTGGSFGDNTDPATTFSGTGGSTYVLRWTISSGACTASTDDVSITFDINTPTTANAGPDQAVCTTSTTLAGNTPVVGTGSWTIISGAGGSLADNTDPATTFTGVAGTSYVLRWTISNGGTCAPSTDDVTVSLDVIPTVANAGPDQAQCATTVGLAANVPASGTGLWSIVSGTGGSFEDTADPGSDFTGTAGTVYVLRWTISNACASTSDDVTIRLDSTPSVAAAGSDQTVCGPATLAANAPVSGIGQWSIISGAGGSFADTADPATTFSGTGGITYVLRWTITSACGNSTDDVSITFDLNTPTTANAGPDQTLCSTNTALAGNAPVVGSGLWTIIGGAGGVITTPASPTSAFSGVAGTTYTLRWTISNGVVCTPSIDEVTIAFEVTPTTAAAGPDQTLCGTSATLAANTATSGTGVWTIVSGTGGSFADTSSPTTGFTGTAGQTYVLAWTISNSCGNSADQVTIKLDAAPTVSAAGPDQTLCGVFTTNLNANTPTVGTGVWTILSGTGGAVVTPNSPTSQFVGVMGNSYTLRWVITNGGSCTPSVDDVVISFSPLSGDQVTFGNDTWIGYVYDDSSNPAPPVSNIDFANAKYKGYVEAADIPAIGTSTYNTATDVFDINIGNSNAVRFQGPNVCGSYVNDYSVRFKMQKVFVAGTYTFTIGGDDGVRLLIDGTPVAGVFTEHAYQTYASTVCLTAGSHDLIIEYFERGGTSRVSFNYQLAPAPDVTSPVAICINSPAAPALTAASTDPGVTDFRWYSDAPLTNLLGTGASFTPTVGTGTGELDLSTVGSTSYFVAAVYACGQGQPATVVVDVVNGATLTLKDTTVCESNGIVDLSTLAIASPAGGAFVFSGHPAIAGTNFDPAGLSGPIPISVDYSVGSCTAPQGTLTVTVTNTSAITVPATPVTVCQGSPVIDLNTLVSAVPAGGDFIFSGSTGITGDNFDPAGLTGNQTIIVDYSIGGGCVAAQQQFTITVVPAATIVTSNTVVCPNAGNVNLLTLVTGTPSGGTFTFTGTGVTGTSFNPSASAGTIVPISVTYNSSGCNPATGTIQITVRNAGDAACSGGQNCGAFTVVIAETRPSCSDQDDGILTFTISGGTPGYIVTLKDPARPAFGQAIPINTPPFVFSFDELSPADYVYTIQDNAGNICTLPYSLPIQTTVNASADPASFIDVSCFGQATGSAIINATGSQTGFYFYSLDNGANWTAFTPGNRINDLPPNGTYNILVGESIGDPCRASVSVTINNANPQISATYDVTSATCNGNDGAITNIVAAGGAGGPYEFSIDGGATYQPEDEFLSLSGGVYPLRIKDKNDCEQEILVSVTFPGFVDFDAFPFAATCDNNGTSGSINVVVNDTGSSFKVALSTDQFNEPDDDQYLNYSAPSVNFEGLANDTYFVYVKSSGAACPTRSQPISIAGPIAISFDIEPFECIDNNLSISLTNIKGDPNTNLEITVYQKFTNEVLHRVDGISFPITRSYAMSYDDPQWSFLRIPGLEVEIQITQLQDHSPDFFCPISSLLVDYRVREPLTARVGAVTKSYPDILNGTMQVFNFNGGLLPYEIQIELDSASVGGQSYQTDWEEVAQNSNLQYEKIFDHIPAGRYKVEIKDSYSCILTLVGRVPLDKDIYVPNIFTPNEDGVNDIFFIRNLPDEGAKLVVTDRWGKQIYSSGNYQNTWDAEDVSDGIYFYRLKIESSDPITGWVEILRGTKP